MIWADITRFLHPGMFWLLLLLPAMIAWILLRERHRSPALRLPAVDRRRFPGKGWRVRLRRLPFVLRLVALVALIVALARPQSILHSRTVHREGIDIALAIDVSGSMQALDMQPNRLDAVKKVAEEFILGRESDRIGLVIFAGESFTQCPLTTDFTALVTLLQSVRSGLLQDGTALGDGLANAVNRLRTSTAKSKVIILLTDGVNNSGAIDPVTAAEIAADYGIKIYTIGAGTVGMALMPAKDPSGRIVYVNAKVEIDEPLLQRIASITGGKYFRATNTAKLRAIYREIDALERTKIESREFASTTELFPRFLMIGALCLLLEWLLSFTVFRFLP